MENQIVIKKIGLKVTPDNKIEQKIERIVLDFGNNRKLCNLTTQMFIIACDWMMIESIIEILDYKSFFTACKITKTGMKTKTYNR
jgi:hypothetical protein